MRVFSARRLLALRAANGRADQQARKINLRTISKWDRSAGSSSVVQGIENRAGVRGRAINSRMPGFSATLAGAPKKTECDQPGERSREQGESGRSIGHVDRRQGSGEDGAAQSQVLLNAMAHGIRPSDIRAGQG
jgi:hypothetical protein